MAVAAAGTAVIFAVSVMKERKSDVYGKLAGTNAALRFCALYLLSSCSLLPSCSPRAREGSCMRISEPEVKKRQGAHRAVTCVSFLVIFVCLNLLLNFLFEPFLGSGAEMWKYFRAKDSLDLVYVGSSQCISALKPDAVDAVLGTRSYNMGSNMQSFHNSCLAVKAAAEEKGVKRVVFVVDYEMLGSDRYENFRAEASFEKAYESGLSPFLRLTAACGFLTDPAFFGKPGSVSYFFPWVYDRDMSIRSNVREKLAGRVLDESGHRDAEGFYPSDEIMVPDDFYISPAQAKEWDATAAQIIDLSLSDSNRRRPRKAGVLLQKGRNRADGDLRALSELAADLFPGYLQKSTAGTDGPVCGIRLFVLRFQHGGQQLLYGSPDRLQGQRTYEHSRGGSFFPDARGLSQRG
jgi:hypothetical protein